MVSKRHIKEYGFSKLDPRPQELRRNQTRHEQLLWETLRNRQVAGLKFRRQHQIGPYILDFFCVEKDLCVELDGAGHFTEDGKKMDEYRDADLKSMGIKVLGFPNSRVDGELEIVVEEIAKAAGESISLPLPSPR